MSVPNILILILSFVVLAFRPGAASSRVIAALAEVELCVGQGETRVRGAAVLPMDMHTSTGGHLQGPFAVGQV